ncbi:hypothetical protein JTE90_005531 [Oedothorax gibbosus]|uniref:Uncharacterized protein n=1 Tax=Oedothorax gibbosus TaxID=931172 RepID=A0AAV6V8Z6_9ARAC|nr:hypothetical protein JTE90_005531 [Oedothorax gibbosus]
MTPQGRTQQTTLSPTLVRIVCVTLTFVSLGCALLGLGLTCFFFESSAPCPDRLTVGAFGVAGGLLGLSLILFVVVCRKKNRLNKETLLEDLPLGVIGGAQYKKKMSGDAPPKLSSADLEEAPQAISNDGEEHFDMTQKSADVSYWIQQQKSEVPSTSSSFPLDHTDGATHHQSENEDDGEMTAL